MLKRFFVSFAIPFVIFVVMSVSVSIGKHIPVGDVLFMSLIYGAMAGSLGILSMLISSLAGRYWKVLASFVFPAIMIGGILGSVLFFQHEMDFARENPLGQDPLDKLFLFGWPLYVGKGCIFPGLVMGIIGLAVYFGTQRQKKG